MLKLRALLFFSMSAFLFFSCNNETKDAEKLKTESTIVDTDLKPQVRRASKKDLTPEDQAMVKSVMARIMTDPQLKRFASYIVTAELANKLSSEEGPFTVFAPSNTALESLTPEIKKLYSNSENRAKLEEMLKSHIVKGKMNKEALLNALNKSGKSKLNTLAGNTLTLTKSDDDLLISDGKGMTAKVVKGSIESSNGVVYTVDNVLNVN